MIRRQLRRVLVAVGLLHLMTAATWAWLWSYRRQVVRRLAAAALDELRAWAAAGPAAGEGAAGPTESSAGRRPPAPARVT